MLEVFDASFGDHKPEDRPRLLNLYSAEWEESMRMPRKLASIIQSALEVGHPEYGAVLARKYARIHRELAVTLGFDRASRLLSFSFLIMRLADERMSATQIAHVIGQQDPETYYDWRVVQRILTRLGIRPSFTDEEVENLISAEMEDEQLLYADADLQTMVDLLDREATRLGFEFSLRELLLTLFDPDEIDEAHVSHLQILLVHCVVPHFYDHPTTYAYEFSPRGNWAKWIYSLFLDGLGNSADPVVANIKAIDRINVHWVVNRGIGDSSAFAFERVLLGLERMGYAARRELCRSLRYWLLRIIRAYQGEKTVVPTDLTGHQIESIAERTCEVETNTQGVIEQAVVDWLSSHLHRPENGWRGRGLLDSVNATNVSRRKLGDCDFQTVDSKQAVAYEAHAGHLTKTYVDFHLHSLKRILPMRMEEWEEVSEPSDWTIEVKFVAHSSDEDLNKALELEGIPVRLVVQTYDELADAARQANGDELNRDLFHRYVTARLNRNTTPDKFRVKLLSLYNAADE